MRRSVDDPSTPLHEVTFCAVDLETTGGSPRACDITEVGAARYRGGELLGTFRSFVRAASPVDPAVAALTGIRDEDLRTAPPAPAVLASLTEFVGGAVLVGHNLRFDLAFLDAALAADERDRVGLRTVDTMLLARRLLGDAVPDHRLATLADHLRLDHRPTHRALDDALATADLLHALLEQAAGLGVAVLDDLVELPRVAGGRHAGKLRLTVDLPRGPGAYVLRDGQGEPLDVGHAADVRRHVRALFAPGAPGAGPLVGALQAVEAVPWPSALVAEVAAIRLTAALRPRRSARLARWRRLRVVRPGGRGAGRLVVGRPPSGAGRGAGRTPAGPGPVLGPLPAEAARTVADALDLLATLPGAPAGRPADLLAALLDDPGAVVGPLRRHAAVARAERRYAVAAATEAMAATVAAAADTQRRRDAWRAGPGPLDDPALPAPGEPGTPAEADELDLLAARAPAAAPPARAAAPPGLRSAAC